MAGETDTKSRTGILKARQRTEQTISSLQEIDPTFDATRPPLRAARAAAAALNTSLEELDRVLWALHRGDHPEVIAARERGPAQQTIFTVENVRVEVEPTQAPDVLEPAALRELLQTAGRLIALPVVERWGEEWRRQAAAWAQAQKEGRELPQPEHVAGPHLEDLDLANLDEARLLLRWAGVCFGDDDGDFGFSPDEWGEAMAWAKAAHRRDRGEQVAVPFPPRWVLPDSETFATLQANVFENMIVDDDEVPGTTRNEVLMLFSEDDFGVRFALDALIRAGEIRESEGGLTADTAEPLRSAEDLADAALRAAMRLPEEIAGEVVDAEYVNGDAASEEEAVEVGADAVEDDEAEIADAGDDLLAEGEEDEDEDDIPA